MYRCVMWTLVYVCDDVDVYADEVPLRTRVPNDERQINV